MTYVAPALVFERKTRLTDIHTPWVTPGGIPHEALEALTLSHLRSPQGKVGGLWDKERAARAFATTHQTEAKKITALFDTLLTLNPGLAPAAFAKDDPVQAATALFGISDQLNAHDIAFFLNTPYETRGEPYANWKKRAQKRAGHKITWIAAPETLRNIEAQLDARMYRKLYPDGVRDPGDAAIAHAFANIKKGQDYLAPALAYEQDTGLTGLHTAWILPDGMTHESMDTRGAGFCGLLMHGTQCRNPDELAQMMATSHKHLADRGIAQFDQLLALNPELRVFSSLRENVHDAETIVCGVTSQLNADDMAFYLSYVDGADISAAKEQMKRVEQRAGLMSWVPSPKTMDRIEAQLDARDAAATPRDGKAPVKRPGI